MIIKRLRHIFGSAEEINSDTFTIDVMIERLQKYRTKKLNQPLQKNSLKVFIAAIRQLRPDIFLKENNTKWSTYEILNKIDFSEQTQQEWSNLYRQQVAKFIFLYMEKLALKNVTNKLEMDACLALILAVTCSLRSNEVQQITFSKLQQIVRGEYIVIRIKKAKKFQQRIMCICKILEPYLPIIQQLYVNSNQLITYSKTSINKYLKTKFIQMYPENKEITTFGLQTARKWITTEILTASQGDMELAQQFNRHSSWHTTDQHYNKNVRSLENELNNIYN